MTATDWRVSITPSPRGDFVTLSGIRYNLTLHDGATVEDYNGLLATLEALGPALFSAYSNGDNGNPPPTTHATSQPAPQQAQDGVEGEDVYGVGWVVMGQEFDLQIDRLTATSTKDGKPQIALTRPNNEYPIAHVPESKFAAFKEATRHDGATMKGETKLDPPLMVRFKLGKLKKDGKKHYIDYVGATPRSQPPANPALFKTPDAPAADDLPPEPDATPDTVAVDREKGWHTDGKLMTALRAEWPDHPGAEIINRLKKMETDGEVERSSAQFYVLEAYRLHMAAKK